MMPVRASLRWAREAKREALDSARMLGMSLLLTMRLFETLPIADVRPATAIVRQMRTTTRFDPREHLPSGIVLTLPYRIDDHRPVFAGDVSLN